MLSDCRLVRLLYSHFYAPVFIFFLIVRTYFYPCILVWIKHQNIKTSKVLIFFLLKTFQHEYQILNSNIYHRNNITTNSWILIFAMTILQLKTFKTQVTTNTITLIYLGLYGSVAKRVSHTVLNTPYLSWKELEPVRSRFFT